MFKDGKSKFNGMLYPLNDMHSPSSPNGNSTLQEIEKTADGAVVLDYNKLIDPNTDYTASIQVTLAISMYC